MVCSNQNSVEFLQNSDKINMRYRTNYTEKYVSKLATDDLDDFCYWGYFIA